MVGFAKKKENTQKKQIKKNSQFNKLESLQIAEEYSSQESVYNSNKDFSIPISRKNTNSTFLKTKSIQKFIKNSEQVNDFQHIIDMGDEVLYIGIIDTLTNFGALKKVEFVAKSVFQGSGISCWPPHKYKKRFSTFMEKFLRNKI